MDNAIRAARRPRQAAALYDARLIPWLAGNEGFVGRYYKCPAGAGTIGYGFTWNCLPFRQWWMARYNRKFGPGDTISKADALVILQRAVDQQYAPPVRSRIGRAGVAVTPHAVAAAIDMVFNCGARALKWSWFKLLLEGRVREAASRFTVTATTANGRKLKGLERRRMEGARIMEGNIWPSWVAAPPSAEPADVERVLPRSQISAEDYWQGVEWLIALKHLPPSAGRLEDAIGAAVVNFQEGHPNLVNDGILGRATLAQLQRVTDLQREVKRTSGAGAAGSGTGALDAASQTSGLGEIILLCSIAATALVLAFLVWRYRDEVGLALRTLGRKL